MNSLLQPLQNVLEGTIVRARPFPTPLTEFDYMYQDLRIDIGRAGGGQFRQGDGYGTPGVV
jgi:hypothetical protein